MVLKVFCATLAAFCSVLLCLSIFVDQVDSITGPSHKKLVVCYISTWAVYRPGRGNFSIESLDPNLCTHVVYAFSGLNISSSSMRSLDPWNDLRDEYGKGAYERATGLKTRYPHLKVTLAIGGWNEGSTNYSILAKDSSRRSAFVHSTVRFLKKYNFDGLDLDWEYPSKRGGAPEDKENFVTFVKELKTEFRKHSLILTAAIGASKETIADAYDVPALSKYLDLLHLMCYDYHGTWDGMAGPNAPLFGATPTDWLTVAYTVDHMLALGVPAEKLVLGMPMYGRSFFRADGQSPDLEALGAPAKSAGFQGPFTREDGFLGYNEICTELEKPGWERHWDPISHTPYATNGDKIIMYDNQRSIAEKVRYAVSKRLRGVMVWSADTDDFLGDCPSEDRVYEEWYIGLKELRKNPFFKDIAPMLRLNLTDRNTGSKMAYSLQDGDLNLIVPSREATNFAIMRTIEEATVLAQQEDIIKQQLDLLSREKERENEIEQKKMAASAGATTRNGAAAILSTLIVAFMAVIAY